MDEPVRLNCNIRSFDQQFRVQIIVNANFISRRAPKTIQDGLRGRHAWTGLRDRLTQLRANLLSSRLLANPAYPNDEILKVRADEHRVHKTNLEGIDMTSKTKPSTTKTSKASENPVWFITGCSTGFGRHIAEHVLKLGYRVVVTSRDPEDVQDLAENGDALILKLNVTDRSQAEKAVKAAEDHFGGIDVLVNNAGIGYFAAVEESDEKEVRKMFDVNVFGLCRMIHLVLPGMRKRRKGYIVNLSSIAGLRSFPGLGYYNSTKFAVEGVSEALWQEVEPLGIKVMLVEPSGFRTDWAGRSANETKHPIADYANTADENVRQLRAVSGHQDGDPARAAAAIVQAIESPNPPHRLLLGNDAFDGANAKLDELREEFAAWESVSRGADFPDATPAVMA